MPTRRQFVQNALLLPTALTTGKAFTQDALKPTAASTTEVFADFEGGNYDGWTIEGDAFGTAPATDALFPGKIKGFTGRSFLCSLHPRKGTAAIGKATSKEFTIEKPFLIFKIGGGNHTESGVYEPDRRRQDSPYRNGQRNP
jgi:levanase